LFYIYFFSFLPKIFPFYWGRQPQPFVAYNQQTKAKVRSFVFFLSQLFPKFFSFQNLKRYFLFAPPTRSFGKMFVSCFGEWESEFERKNVFNFCFKDLEGRDGKLVRNIPSFDGR